MGDSGSRLDQARLRATLITVFDHMTAPVEYRLVGTGAALLRGVPLPAGDVDILVKTRDDVNVFGAGLSSFKCLVPPVWMPETRQYYAEYDVNGVGVEISTVEIESDQDTIETFGRGPWEHYSVIQCGPYAIPTVALELRLITELFRSRPDRFTPIIHFMQATQCDLDFLSRGMDACGLPPTLKEDILTQLRERPE